MVNRTRKPYLTPHEVAELLMVSPVTVRQWAQRGQLPAQITPGGHRRFFRHDVERFARVRGLTLQDFDEGETRILIVDDDRQFSRFLEEYLHTRAVEVVTELAHDGFVAGQKIATFRPRIVLLDLMMPGLDGFEVCRRIKSDPNTRAVRVIAMTGYHSEEHCDRIIKVGAEVCLEKPLDTDELIAHLGLESPDGQELRSSPPGTDLSPQHVDDGD